MDTCIFYEKVKLLVVYVLFVLSLSRARPSAGDNCNEHWSPVEHITSFSNGLHGNHLYTSVSGYVVDQPLPLTKSSHDIGVGERERSVIGGTVERQQVCQISILWLTH